MRRVNLWHVAILCGFLITHFVFWTYFYVSYSIEQEQARSLEYDTVWSSTNGRNEFYRLSASLNQYLATRTPEDLDALSVKYEILLARLETWNSGNFRRFLNSNREMSNVFSQLKTEVTDLGFALENISESTVTDIHARMEKIASKIEVIAGKSYQTSIERFADERADFQDRLMTEKRIVMGLLVLATCLLAVVMRQNWILKQANAQIAGDADQLSYMAKHDALTGLANRTLVDEHLRQAKANLSDDEVVLAVALDLDGFKAINDTLGHAGGDALLIALAKRLNLFVDGISGQNLAARVGGDEFMLLFWCRKKDLDCDSTIRFLSGQFNAPLETTIGSLLVGTSIGYAIAIERDDLDTVVLNADLALTEAKLVGPGTDLRFSTPMRTRMERRLRIERELPDALANSLIKPHYQLQYNIVTGEPIGLEALARWNHCDIGPVSPSEFIPIAEASGDVVELGRLMLRSACRDVQFLPDHMRVSVNLSMIQLLNDDVVALVRDTLEQTGLDPRRLKLEVTESVIMHNVELVAGVLSKLQAMGVSISLDDFGTGYSALSYLSNFKWDELKIDRSFVLACESSPKALNIINVIMSLAYKMNADLLVEGLETREQAKTFQRLGCRFGQGYYFSKPIPVEQLREIPFNEVEEIAASNLSVAAHI
ncbi:putative bifunctional diguanylate cyclase/phosphodiesterase [Roseibium sp.]|uniref:putative bifunctional diguanylate cyclase/phosphodiesterase n=1 Tax=Roseibium sp. TaxID=1936156 RepID=UPI0039EE4E9D